MISKPMKLHLLTCWHKHMGDQGKNLKFIMRGVVIPGTCISQLPLTDEAYSTDNKSVYHLFKSFLINTSGWTWIEPYDTMENGHGAFLAWTSHYNGQGELLKCTAMAKAAKDQKSFL
jgi:hypothetical protein